MNDALEFAATSDQRVNLALQGQRVKVDGVVIERSGGVWRIAFCLTFCFGARRAGLHLADPVRDEINHVQPGDFLLLQVINGVRVLLAENGDQNIGAVDFLLAGGLHVENGALDDPLETQRRLRVNVFFAFHRGRVFGDKSG